jgi:hypothetical protein
VGSVEVRWWPFRGLFSSCWPKMSSDAKKNKKEMKKKLTWARVATRLEPLLLSLGAFFALWALRHISVSQTRLVGGFSPLLSLVHVASS